MPKQAKSSIAKVRQTCQEHPRRVSQMRQKVFVESHRKSKLLQGKLETKSKSQSEQTFLHFDQVNFKEQVVS